MSTSERLRIRLEGRESCVRAIGQRAGCAQINSDCPMRCGGQPENCCSGRLPSLPRRRNEHPGGSYPSAMLRLLTAALLARTAHSSCARAEHVCRKYLDETWAGRGQYACNQSWAEAQGYDACPPPETCDFALAQQGDDTCKPARCQEGDDTCRPARCQASGCCNSS